MTFIPPIDPKQLAIYRAAALAYRKARRSGKRQQECQWAATAAVIERCPEMTHRECAEFAARIVRYVSLYYRGWFGDEPISMP
jgi:hypothetical protein